MVAAGARAFMVLEAERMTTVLTDLELETANGEAAATDASIARRTRLW
jgi:hypothetical protein